MFGIYSFSFKKDNEKSGIKALSSSRGMFMIGEVDLSADQYNGLELKEACLTRIRNEAQPKNGLEHFDLQDFDNFQFFICEGEKNHQDSEFHKWLSISGYKMHTYRDLDGNKIRTEIVEGITKEEVQSQFQAWQKGDRNFLRTKNYSLREYQRGLVDKAKDILKWNNRVLINLSTRGGKSLTALTLAKEIGAQNILILTPFPSAVDSFRKEVLEQQLFKDWWFHSKSDVKEDIDYGMPTKNVFFLSFQIFDKDKDSKKKIKQLLEAIEFDTVIIDETHRQSSSERSQIILDYLGDVKQIHLSGTPFNDIYSNRFKENEIVTLDFIDLLALDKKTHCVGFPSLEIKNVCNMEELNKLLVEKKPDLFEKDLQFNLRKVFEDSNKAVAKQKAAEFLNFALNPKSYVTNEESTSVLAKHSHILIFVPSVKAVNSALEALNGLKETVPFLNEFEIAAPYKFEDAPDNLDLGDVERSLNEFQSSYKKSIIVTCAKLTTGVTLKKCDCILLMKQMNSAEVFIQTLFRCMTSEEGKKRAVLYNYDSECCLKVVKEVCQIKQVENEKMTERAVIDKFLSVINISCLNSSFEFETQNASSYLQKIKEIPVKLEAKDVFTNFSLENIDEIESALENIELESVNSSMEIATGVGGNEKVVGSKPPKKESSEKNEDKPKKERDNIREKLCQLMRNLDWTIILESVESRKDFDKLLRAELKYIDNDVLKDAICQLFSLNRQKICNFIEDLNDSWNNNKSTVLKNLSLLNPTDFPTPDSLIEKMVGKFRVISEKDKILDPCCGRGSMLLYLNEVCGVPKENLYGIDISKRNVELCHKLGFNNVVCGDVLNCKAWENLKEMIFDKIIMNPPFTEGTGRKNGRYLYKQIYDICKNYAKDTCMLCPDSYKRFLQNGKEKITDYEEVGIFPGVGQYVGIFASIKGSSFVDPSEFRTELDELNDKIRENAVENSLFERLKTAKKELKGNKLGIAETYSFAYSRDVIVPKGYIGMAARAGSLRLYLPGENPRSLNNKEKPVNIVYLSAKDCEKELADYMISKKDEIESYYNTSNLMMGLKCIPDLEFKKTSENLTVMTLKTS